MIVYKNVTITQDKNMKYAFDLIIPNPNSKAAWLKNAITNANLGDLENAIDAYLSLPSSRIVNGMVQLSAKAGA